MRIYRIELNATFSGVYFDFIDYGEMMGFLGQALESGIYKGGKIKATIEVIDDEEVVNEY